MTEQERDYEAILSRVLHTTTDQVEPVGDGLTKIRTRLSEPWLKRQWWLLCNEFMMLRWLVVLRCESLFSRIRSRSDVTDLAPDASAGQEADGAPLRSLLSIATLTQTKQPRSSRPAGPAMAWFRPALAVAGAVVLVVAGVFALGSIRTVAGLDANNGTSGSTTGQQSQNGSANGSASPLRGSATASQGHSRAASSSASAGHSETAPASSPCEGASTPSPTSGSPSPSPTSGSPSPSPTSGSPSPSPSTSQAPLTGPVPGHTQEAIGTTALVCAQAATAPRSPVPSGQ